MKNIVLNRSEKICLFFTGIFLPLITLRVKLPIMSISFFILSLGILILLNIKFIIKSFAIYKTDVLIALFLIITLVSSFYSENRIYGITQWIKLLIVVILFVLSRSTFYKKPYYINIIMKYASVSMALYLIYLIWTYIFIFNQTYIGLETSFVTKAGKNSLAFIVSFILPFTITLFLNKLQKYGLKYFDLSIFIVSLVGAALIQSRALYLLIGIYTLITLLNFKINLKSIRKLTIISIIIIILIYILAPPQVISDLTTRIRSIVLLVDDGYVIDGNIAVTGVGSIDSRKNLINKGLNMFYEKPIIGHGIGSYKYYGGEASAVSHNDYVQVIAEQGLIGLLVFLMLIGVYVRKSFFIYHRNKELLWVFLSMVGITFYFFMINAYDNIIVWILFAIIDTYNSKDKNLIKC